MRGTRTKFALIVLIAAWAASVHAERVVTVQVHDASGQPVAGARVLIAADEKDAVGTTDARGEVTLRTSSASVSVTVQKGASKASAAPSKAATIDVELTGGAQ